jgi:hypothetical protein
MKGNYGLVLAQLAIEIDLLARLEHADGVENFLSGWGRGCVDRQDERNKNDE